MFNPINEDDNLFMPQNPSSNLAELFDSNPVSTPGNRDLMYVAPKQPKSVTKSQAKPQSKPKLQTTVLFAKVVFVYKSQHDDTRKLIGKYALALIGDTTGGKEIILYKDKQNILAKVIFTHDTEIRVENEHNCLGDFLDKLKQANVKVTIKKIEVKHVDTTDSIDNSNGDNESLTQTKADILTRMAKMGQPILPGNIKGRNDNDPVPSSPPIVTSKKTGSSNVNDNLNANYQSPNENLRNVPYFPPEPTNQISPYHSVYAADRLPNPSLINTVITSQEFNLFTSENRIQNSEVRMNLNALSHKLDNVLSEISKIREPNTDKLENDYLKSKISDLERNINNLTKQLDEVNNSSKEAELEMIIKDKDRELNSQKCKIVELESSLKNMEDLRSKIVDFESREMELNEKVHYLEEKLNETERDLQECNLTNTELQETNMVLHRNNDELDQKAVALESKLKSLQLNVEQKLKGLADIIKESMNTMYQNLMGQFEEPQQNQIKAILSTNIKQTTFNVIQKFQQYLLSTDNLDKSINNNEAVAK
ncbi:fk506-binding protein 15 [Holotrichia oblita]|uniref:Fk506-binding protein 15 n=1 Tax=Holotrichia oblita TaxID=644536 RepID=A0ACB9SWF5_HOLOL|nr:fk506-binding protein 15 [Holotrichia oblita]